MGISGTVSTVLVLTMLLGLASLCAAVNVTYDSRALVIDGKRRVLVSGSIHYPRSTPEVSLYIRSLILINILIYIYIYIVYTFYIILVYVN